MGQPLFISIEGGRELVIATDNAGGIGLKADDMVHVSYKKVVESLFRVSLMDCLAVGATPFAVTISNFVGDEVWGELEQTVRNLGNSLGYSLDITGSTESNMEMSQSAISLSILGWVGSTEKRIGISPEICRVALIGEPLVGKDVLSHPEKIAPLELFAAITKQNWVFETLPVGSKGIQHSVEVLEKRNGWGKRDLEIPFDEKASGGPSTSFMITYDQKWKGELLNLAGSYITLLN
ncbi:ATPase [Halobacillus shinanisalinarum]|uniref:ATPase n=1 Tax=Halobacillus shinanisalinarum TaxID=2932258 RepID=A0ABY4H5M3_9BACI|nr:ATPase [Halobacillus shinanisalinarum]UOQ95400.1 ATPase [Halobacillus shinanisalinarum]